MRGAVAAFAVAALGLGAHLKSSAPPPPESALDKGLALAAAQTPHGIGSKVGDRRRLTRADRLAILRAQLTDPSATARSTRSCAARSSGSSAGWR
jgi:hypothetical protein